MKPGELRRLCVFLLHTSLIFEKAATQRLAVACEDTKPKGDCEFMHENNWCDEDIKYLKRQCDYTCGWCSESNECVDRGKYLNCKNLTKEECNSDVHFYATRCRKSCNWCNGLPQGAWKTWSQWTECSATCNPGFRIRSRHCLFRKCEGPSSEVDVCMIKMCETWKPWNDWTSCSATCGSGVKTRTRICPPNALCSGPAIERTPCEHLTPCEAGGIVFGEWSPCSRSCGGGTRKMIMYCPAADPNTCEKKFEDCNTHKCPYKSCATYRYGSEKSSCCKDREGGCIRASRRVLGGTPVKPKQFAWMARIEITERGRFRRLQCGGTLIHSEFVLTAAHCLDGVKPADLQVLLGAISRFDTSTLTQRKMVANFTKHPDYDRSTLVHDIAIIRLASRAAITEFVTTLCLPEGEETPIDNSCFVAGWGLTSPDLLVESPNLLEAKIRHLPFEICSEGHRLTPYGPTMNINTMMCAGLVAGGKDTCSGDSGGPIMCQRCSSCSWYIAGLTSFGAATCGIANVPGVYTRVNHYEKWINDVVKPYNSVGVVCTQF